MCEKRFTEKRMGKNILRNGIVSVHSDGFGSFYEGDAIDRLAEYETALEEGRLVTLPHKECEGEGGNRKIKMNRLYLLHDEDYSYKIVVSATSANEAKQKMEDFVKETKQVGDLFPKIKWIADLCDNDNVIE